MAETVTFDTMATLTSSPIDNGWLKWWSRHGVWPTSVWTQCDCPLKQKLGHGQHQTPCTSMNYSDYAPTIHHVSPVPCCIARLYSIRKPLFSVIKTYPSWVICVVRRCLFFIVLNENTRASVFVYAIYVVFIVGGNFTQLSPTMNLYVQVIYYDLINQGVFLSQFSYM